MKCCAVKSSYYEFILQVGNLYFYANDFYSYKSFGMGNDLIKLNNNNKKKDKKLKM